jgi:hypothetical protein
MLFKSYLLKGFFRKNPEHIEQKVKKGYKKTPTGFPVGTMIIAVPP